MSLLSGRILEDAVVVLDDIERKDHNLRLEAIFGVVSRLTEIRKVAKNRVRVLVPLWEFNHYAFWRQNQASPPSGSQTGEFTGFSRRRAHTRSGRFRNRSENW